MSEIKEIKKKLKRLKSQQEFYLSHAKDNNTKKGCEAYISCISLTLQCIRNKLTLNEVIEKLKDIDEEKKVLLKYNKADENIAKGYIFCISRILRIIKVNKNKEER